MPPKTKKKRASLKLDASGQIKKSDETISAEAQPKAPPVRQVVEVVGEDTVPEALDTIKKDVEEIEDAVETIEEEVVQEEVVGEARGKQEVRDLNDDTEEEPKANIESLFVKSQPSVDPEITVVGKRGVPLGVWVGAMLGVALAIGVSLVFLVRGPSVLPFLTADPTPTIAPTAQPTPTPASVVERSSIKVSVINGGGTPGAGGKMKSFLEEKGWTVTNVGNADEYSYEQTEILVKAGKEEFAKLLADDLKADFSLGSSSGEVDETAAFDAQVIVGKE